MHSRFKFLSCVDPKQKGENTPTKARFSKLTLRKVNTVDETKRIIPPAQETSKLISEIGNKNTVPKITTNMDENAAILPRKESEDNCPTTENKNTGQKPKLLLYESTVESTSNHSEPNSSLLTDDDTDSVGSSVDTNFFNNALANEKVSQPPAQKVNEIESQLENLSISTPIAKTSRDNRINDMSNLSQKFNELDLIKETDEFKAFEQKAEMRSFLDCSAITLSSRASSPDRKPNTACDTSRTQLTDEVIELLDTSDEEQQPDTLQPAKQKSGEGYFYNVTPAAANCERLDSLVMQRINNFFDNVPELNPDESSVLSAELSKHDSVYVSETSIEEENQNVSLDKSSINENEISSGKRDDKSIDHSTHFDTPAYTNSANEKQSNAQSKDQIESESNSTPLKSASNAISSKQSTGNTPAAVKSSGSSVQITSINSGHINISAVININIKISERSSSGDSVIKVNPNSAPIETPELEINSNKSETPPPNQNESKSARSSTNTDAADSDVSQAKSVDKTPSEHSQTNNQVEPATNAKASKDDDAFKVDENLSVDAKQQKLLNSLYGPAWKTPEVLRSFRKDKQNDLNDKQFNPPVSRMSKGFNLFKRNIATDLDSTRIDEISIIENTEISVIQNVEINQKFQSIKNPNTCENTTKTSPTIRQRNTRKAALKVKQMLQKDEKLTDDDTSSENADEDSDWRGDASDSESDNAITTSTKSKQTGTRKITTTSTKTARRKPAEKRNKNKDDQLVYLDLSANEVVEVDENFSHNQSEEDLAEMTKRFLEDDLSDGNKGDKAEEKGDFKKPKPSRRKLFTHQYGSLDDDLINQTNAQRTPATKTRGTNESEVKIDIPQFIFKPRKLIGTTSSTTTTTTPLSKELPKPMRDAVTQSLNVKPKGGLNRIISNAENNVRSSKTMKHPDIFVTPARTHGFLKSLDVCVSTNLCHPDALIYRNNFKANKEELTKLLYDLYNEKIFENKLDVSVTWNKKLISTAGRCVCNQRASTGRYARIELSEKVVTSADRLRCTLIHELCHAATWVHTGGKGHGVTWKLWASRAQKVFPELPQIKVCHDYDIEYKYTYKCDICQSKSHSHSKSKKVENIRCSYCHGSISIFINKKLKDGKIVQTPVREASGFAKFVKEKYKEFKVPGKTHAEIMRLISDNFSALSVEEKKKY